MQAELLSQLLLQTLREIAAQRRFPEATYRLQFHAGFTFRDAQAITGYLHELGITHCYASPFLKARPGSQHGYDIVDHDLLNPEIGAAEDFCAWRDGLTACGMALILDVVPNHMGIASDENVWWNDVLENGPASPHAAFFDIAWYASTRPELQGRVILPTLGDSYAKVLESQQLRLDYRAGAFAVCYFDRRFPLSPSTYGSILGHRLAELEGLLPADAEPLLEYHSILTAIRNLPSRLETDPGKVAELQREKEVIKRRLSAVTEGNEQIRGFIDDTVGLYNGRAGEPRSFDLLEPLLENQPYRLCFWRVASDEINYRRFFDVNELAALSMERDDVFAATHRLVLRLLAEGGVSGLRIDHPDGLYDPRGYLARLQREYVVARAEKVFLSEPAYRNEDWAALEGPLRDRLAEAAAAGDWTLGAAPDATEGANGGGRFPLYVIAEKILGAKEALPEDWPIYGTSGYGFLNLLNGLFVDVGQADALTKRYQEWIQDDLPFAELVYHKKFLILQIAMSSELHMLAAQLDHVAQQNRASRDFTLHSLRHALREVIACFPVYRSYISSPDMREADRRHVLWAVGRARAKNPAISDSIFTFVRDMLLLKYPVASGEKEQEAQRRFVGKFQQVTAPVMAKGLEDTACYVYVRLLSLNEVGGDPGRFGVPPAALHRYFQERQAHWPWAFSATATHDTKRGEDARARLNVLSELPQEWHAALVRWSEFNRELRVPVEDGSAPDANEEWFLYQALLGAWPLTPGDAGEYSQFVQRFQAYVQKALHEAKVHSSWINPDSAYDKAMHEFVGRILDPQRGGPFLADFAVFQRRIAHYGLFNSLSQLLVKIAAPGVVDTYQGTELWDFSLVDPDNRRPVDYEHRRGMLADLKRRAETAGAKLATFARELVDNKEDGRIKLYTLFRALHCRRGHPGLYATGDYLPAEIDGPRCEHAFGFVRRRHDALAVAVVPRLLTSLVSAAEAPLGEKVWDDTVLILPESVPDRPLTNAFSGDVVSLIQREGRAALRLSDAFAHFPVALLVSGKLA